MNKVKYISVFALSILLSGLLLAFSAGRSAEAICEATDIRVEGDPSLQFVTQESLMTFLAERGHGLSGLKMEEVDTYAMEEDLKAIDYVADAQVYKTMDRTVVVSVRQRVPILRAFFQDGSSAYVDEQGRYMPLSSSYSKSCLAVTGLARPDFSYHERSTVEEGSALHQLWRLAHHIRHNNFWSAQIVQLDMDSNLGAVMIPRVGNHQIILGGLSDYDQKLEKLETFYNKGIEQTNWNIYKTIDLRYEGQVVGVKR